MSLQPGCPLRLRFLPFSRFLHRSVSLGLLWAVVLASPGAARGSEDPDGDPGRRAAERLSRALEADGGSGVQAAVVVDGRLAWSAAFGHADLEADLPLDTTTRLRIGSVSKIFTAALVARLVEAGSFDPDVPIQRYVPDFPEHQGMITGRRLANHTSGIRHYDFANLAEANNVQIYQRLDDALAVFANDPLVAPPGSRFHYSSFGFNLLGVAAARAAALPYLDTLRRYVTEPLGLERTVGDESLRLIAGRGRFYTVRQDGVIINTIWRDSSDFYPAGGLLSTAEDLARFAWAAFHGEPFGPTARRLFSMPTRLESGDVAGSPVGYTFGWQIETDDTGEVRWFGHGGLTNGATAEVRIYPRHGVAVAVIANYNFWFDGSPSVIEVGMGDVAPLFFPRHP